MSIDPTKRQALIDHCERYARDHDGELPAVTLEQFFDGNDDRGSFMCNVDLDDFEVIRRQIFAIRDRPEVSTVLVPIHETMEEEDGSWPFAEQLLIATSASPEQILEWFDDRLVPGDLWVPDDPPELPALPAGHRVYVAWWD